jgi:predicted dehydrogenase
MPASLNGKTTAPKIPVSTTFKKQQSPSQGALLFLEKATFDACMYTFALIGCGRIAPRHAENMIRIGRLVAVCDAIPAQADSFAKTYNAKPYYNLDDLLAQENSINVVSICTPNGYHAEHAIKALRSGKHVLCEKPMCLTSAAAWQMLETEKFSGKRLFVVKSTRYNPYVLQVKEMLDKGKLGQVYSFQLHCFWYRPAEYYTGWRGKAFPDGGTLYTQFSHYIDALIWLLGDIETAHGFSKNSAHRESMEFEDTGVAALQLSSGVIGTLNWSVNTYRKNFEIGLTLIAEKGTFSLGGPYLNEVRYACMENPVEPIPQGKNANEYGFYAGSMSNHSEVYDSLLNALNGENDRFTSALEGLKTVEAIERIYKAVSCHNAP